MARSKARYRLSLRLPSVLLVLFSLSVVLACTNPDDADSGATPASEATFDETAWRAGVEAWHADREERLASEDGWLSVAGLYWLEEGGNRFGSDPENEVVFPEPAPGFVGSFELAEGQVTLTADPGAGVTHQGEPVERLALASDAEEQYTGLELGTFTFYLIERVGKVGVRLKDSQRSERLDFTGIERFPVDPAWRITARLERYPEPKAIKIPNVLGSEFDYMAPGMLVFEVDGEEFRIEPTGSSEEGLFLVFGDLTNGKESYGGGRFLSVDPFEGDSVVVDFNRTYNPPCVFTPYATCPLPPPQNKLAVAIPAGEKMYGGLAH